MNTEYVSSSFNYVALVCGGVLSISWIQTSLRLWHMMLVSSLKKPVYTQVCHGLSQAAWKWASGSRRIQDQSLNVRVDAPLLQRRRGGRQDGDDHKVVWWREVMMNWGTGAPSRLCLRYHSRVDVTRCSRSEAAFILESQRRSGVFIHRPKWVSHFLPSMLCSAVLIDCSAPLAYICIRWKRTRIVGW